MKRFPDGTIIDEWFFDNKTPSIADFPNKYYLKDYVLDKNKIITLEFQSLIDLVHDSNGGLIIISDGIYKTGAIFLKSGVSLYIEKNAIILGSDDISDYPVLETRIEGETCMYYPALINADNIDGISIFGDGIIDGNGMKSWKAFWQRRKWNPKCQNKDEQRPRLIYISNSKNVIISGLTLQNSHFWTTHIYKCNNLKLLNLNIYSPYEPIKAPSTDAIDIDACSDILIDSCSINVNDDGIALKGGKGPYADTDSNNGSNERIIIRNCHFEFCHACLTCGSESIHNRNIILEDSNVIKAKNLLWLKMRPDTPQIYEYIRINNIKGYVNNLLFIKPWTQFFDLGDRVDIPLSYANNIYLSNIFMDTNSYFSVIKKDDQYKLSNFKFENLFITANKSGFSDELIDNIEQINVNIKIKN